jgi:hypothetical protein
MRSTVLILTALLLGDPVAGLVPRVLAANSYERELELDGRFVLKSDELMRPVEFARVNLPNKDTWRESLRLNADDSKFTLGEGGTIEDVTRVGATHSFGRYALMGLSIYVELIWHEHHTRPSVGAKDRDKMEMVSAVLD